MKLKLAFIFALLAFCALHVECQEEAEVAEEAEEAEESEGEEGEGIVEEEEPTSDLDDVLMDEALGCVVPPEEMP